MIDALIRALEVVMGTRKQLGSGISRDNREEMTGKLALKRIVSSVFHLPQCNQK